MTADDDADDLAFVRCAIERASSGEFDSSLAAEVHAAVLPASGVEEGELSVERQEALGTLIREMTVPQRVKLALFGNLSARTILLRDPNRLIPFYVLENPRISEPEIVDISRNSQVDEGVLRAVSQNQQWTKNYQVRVNLVSNPRTPIDVSVKWLKYLRDRELRLLARSKNIPQVISSQARKLVEKQAE